MYGKFFTVLALAALAVANSTQCTSGKRMCCSQLSNAQNPSIQKLLGSVGLTPALITGQVGVSCVPVTAIGTGSGADCSEQPVCCDDDNYNGIVAVGCSPINGDV